MPRNVTWRRTFSEVTCASQALAANATMYILRQTGPTGFLLKEEDEPRTLKVFLGDPHHCTCAAFRKDKDLCKHICWILLKKFRLNKDNPLSWQLGLSDLELDEVMRGPVVPRQSQQQLKSAPHLNANVSGGRPLVPQREIAVDDVCPICQEEFMEKKLPVTYCKFSCGNNIHIKCMKIWAEHQLNTTQDHSIKCPMCREDFGPITLLKQEMRNASRPSTISSNASVSHNRMDRHVGLGCSNCRIAPIEGKCYRCCTCADFYLCQACFNTPAHTHHAFQFRHKRNQKWHNAQRMLGAALPDAVVNDLLNRELSETDYDTLLQLDSTISSTLSDLTEESVRLLPLKKVREKEELLAPGVQCRICLRGFKTGQYVRKLPCQHQFHKDCIDNWLLHSHPTCPLDSLPVFTSRPHSHSDSKHSNREASLSVSSQGFTKARSFMGISEGLRSRSVPALEISSLQIGVSQTPERQHKGEKGRQVLAQHHPRNLHILRKPLARLQLTGNRVEVANNRSDRLGPDMLASESHLLHQAIMQLSEPSQHLTHFTVENSLLPAIASLDHRAQATLNKSQDHIHLSPVPVDQISTPPGHHADSWPGDFHFQTNNSHRIDSLGDRGHQKQKATILRSKARLRPHNSSCGHVPPASLQDLYLGNDPRFNPPPEGEVTAAVASNRAMQHLMIPRPPLVNRKGKDRDNNPSIMLEGNAVFDHATLRDIL